MRTILLIAWSILPLLVLAQIPPYIPSDGLVGWYPMSGNANDLSESGNNGVVVGATLAEDRFGNANSSYFFDGVDDFIITNPWDGSVLTELISDPDDINFGYSEFVISFWVKWADVSTLPITSSLIHKRQGELLDFHIRRGALGADGLFASAAGESEELPGIVTNSSEVPWIYDEWNHVYMRLFFDPSGESILDIGVNHDSWWEYAVSPGYQMGVSEMMFGAADGQGFFHGYLDDVAIWKRGLSPTEFDSILGGTFGCCDSTACNFDVNSDFEDGTCEYSEAIWLDCEGNCVHEMGTILGSFTPSAFSQESYVYPEATEGVLEWTVNGGVISSGQGTNEIQVVWGGEGVGEVSLYESFSDECFGDTTLQIVIVPDETWVNDIEKEGLDISLQHEAGKLFFISAMNKISVVEAFDLSGARLAQQHGEDAMVEVDLLDWQSGFYVFRVLSALGHSRSFVIYVD